MPIGEEVAGAVKGPGKKWLLGGAVLGLGYLWYTRVRPGRAVGASGSTAGGVGITSTGQAIDPVATPPGGDYSPATPGANRPATNVEWLAQAVAVLGAPPYNRPAVPTFNALSRALAGDPITTAEASIVELALQAVGTPPDGMPVLNISSTAGPTTTPAASSAAYTAGDNLYDWSDLHLPGHKTAGEAFTAMQALNPGLSILWKGNPPVKVPYLNHDATLRIA